ncbi:MAG: hypothetical protein AAGH78_06145 [Cyanobacteria bacterium P01_H01_bin.58]
MNRQVIEYFLELPGIAGVALMDGHSQPYFCGVEQALNYQQKEALTQGIQQVINTTPASFDCFDFRFSQQEAHIYKLIDDIILLVITTTSLDTATYQDGVTELKQTIQADPHNAVATFRLLASGKTFNHSANHEAGSPPIAESTELASPLPPAKDTYHWGQVVMTLNTLTDATAQYLGKIVVANAWRSTRPEDKVLEHLQLDRNGHFTSSAATTEGDGPVSLEDQTMLSNWVQQFIRRCSMILRDYADIVLMQALDEQQRSLLQIEIHQD